MYKNLNISQIFYFY